MMNTKNKQNQQQYMQEFRRQHKRVELNLSLPQYKAFQKAALAEQLSVSQTIKNMAVAYEQQCYFIPQELKDKLDALHFLIRNIANNVNQLTHYSHTLQVMVDEHNLLLELKKLEDIVTQFTLAGIKK